MNLLTIIPVYNEELNIATVVAELKNTISYTDILLINDCSTDNSLETIKQIEGISYLNLSSNLGYSGALQAGFKYAVKNGYDFVLQFDGDGQHIASEALKLIDIMSNENVDIVIGSRFKEQSTYNNTCFRKLGTSMFRFTIKKICKVDITDPTSGFQLLNKDVIKKYAKMYNYPEFPDTNLIIEMLLRGYKIREYQVTMRKREFGESMHSGILKPIKYMIKMFYSIFLILISKKHYKQQI